jgi:hypothetical protein
VGSDGRISTNQDIAKSSVLIEGTGFRGAGHAGLDGPVTVDSDGNRHFTISGEGTNGFSGMGGPAGDIKFKIKLTVTPSGEASVDSVTGRTFPSLEVFVYSPGATPQLLFAFSENAEGDLTKPEQRLDQPEPPRQ